jgi:hypothetical protein
MQIDRPRRTPAWRKRDDDGADEPDGKGVCLDGLRQCHPDDAAGQRRRRLADLLVDSELAARANGPLAEG